MRRVSQVISGVALGLMGVGFVRAWASNGLPALPGEAAIPLPMLLQLHREPIGLMAMSVGIVLLALLPTVRVLLALLLYLRRQRLPEGLAGLLVLLELLLSMRTGG
ncbi:MAG: DUF1634 domain-containing protein [Chloroflexi bacterium]|nr:MAG: DUF1634 domain-containing protein [Chloroflexota bacterium]